MLIFSYSLFSQITREVSALPDSRLHHFRKGYPKEFLEMAQDKNSATEHLVAGKLGASVT